MAEGDTDWVYTSSTSEDATPATGWEIGDGYESRTASSTGSFAASTVGTLQIRVNGTLGGIVISSDATLSALALEDASDDSAITISPTFASGTTSYTASVDSDVDEITIKPAVNESSATVEYLDSSDPAIAIADADSGKAGQQVSLAVGANTIKVKVTAEDTTTNTYTVVVTRVTAPVCAVPDFGTRRDIWTSTVDVEAISVLGSVVGYGFDSGTAAGSLADNTFSIGSNDYTVGGIADVVTDIFKFTLTSDLTSTEVAALKLHVCETGYDFADATHTSSTHLYEFAVDLDWSMESTRTVYLSLPANNPATGAPEITGTAQVGQELTADVTTVADADGIVSSTAIYQWFRIDAGTETAIPEARGNLLNQYTLMDDDAGKQLRVKLTFTDQLGGEETLTSAAFPSGATVAAAPAITIAADRPTATGKLDWVHYALSRGGDTADALTVTVTFAGPAGNDWSLDPTGSAKREVTFTAGDATAEQSIRLVGSGFGNIGFSASATTSGALTARLGAKTGYDTRDTDEVEVVVTSGPAWVIRLAEDAYRFDEDGGDQDIELVATAASADVPAPSLDTTDDSVLRLAVISAPGTARSPGDYASFSRARYFPSSGCSADPNAGNVQVCRLNVTFTPADDAVAEPDETLELVLQPAPGGSTQIHFQGPGPDRTVSDVATRYTVTIVDDQFGVTGVDVTSTPQQATDTYGAWEHIEISVSFNKPVTVTGAPTFAFDLGGAETAAYQGGSGTGTLVFSYQVMPDDSDTNGISWAANALSLVVDTSGGGWRRPRPSPSSRRSRGTR